MMGISKGDGLIFPYAGGDVGAGDRVALACQPGEDDILIEEVVQIVVGEVLGGLAVLDVNEAAILIVLIVDHFATVL